MCYSIGHPKLYEIGVCVQLEGIVWLSEQLKEMN